MHRRNDTGDAGIVEDDIETSKGRDGFGHRARHLRFIRYVGPHGDRPVADLGGQGQGALPGLIDDRDSRAFRDEAADSGGANRARAARHEHGLACETRHEPGPSSAG